VNLCIGKLQTNCHRGVYCKICSKIHHHLWGFVYVKCFHKAISRSYESTSTSSVAYTGWVLTSQIRYKKESFNGGVEWDIFSQKRLLFHICVALGGVTVAIIFPMLHFDDKTTPSDDTWIVLYLAALQTYTVNPKYLTHVKKTTGQ